MADVTIHAIGNLCLDQVVHVSEKTGVSRSKSFTILLVSSPTQRPEITDRVRLATMRNTLACAPDAEQRYAQLELVQSSGTPTQDLFAFA